MDLHGLQGHSLPHHGLLHGLQGTSAPAPGALLPTPSALSLGSAELFLSHSLTPLFQVLLHSSFFPLLNYAGGASRGVRSEVEPGKKGGVRGRWFLDLFSFLIILLFNGNKLNYFPQVEPVLSAMVIGE